MNTTELVVEIRPEKIQARTEFEPMTSAIPMQRFSIAEVMGSNPVRAWTFQVLFQLLVQLCSLLRGSLIPDRKMFLILHMPLLEQNV